MNVDIYIYKSMLEGHYNWKRSTLVECAQKSTRVVLLHLKRSTDVRNLFKTHWTKSEVGVACVSYVIFNLKVANTSSVAPIPMFLPLCGAEYHSRGHQLCSRSAVSEPEGSLPLSQELSTCTYPEPDRCSPPPHSIYTRSILRLSTILRLVIPSGLFPTGSPTNNLYAVLFSPVHLTVPAHLIPDLIILVILGEDRNHTAPRYAVFSTLPSLNPCLVQTFSSAPCP
jgi:hypothetical protein